MDKIIINSELNDDWMKRLPGYQTEVALIKSVGKKHKKPLKLKMTYKGGTGSGFHGHAGRPGQVGGSTTGSPEKVAAARNYIAAMVDIHNKALPEYKKAFAAVGAKLWPMDDAHKQDKDSLVFMQNQVEDYVNRNVPDAIVGVYGLLPTPLTVLDSYPQVTDKQKAWLRDEVNKIHTKYQTMLDAESAKLNEAMK